jgi:dipeptidyl aminopeptidase/acylaminoacyl peptidase
MLRRSVCHRGLGVSLAALLLLPWSAHGQDGDKTSEKKPAWAPATSFQLARVGSVQPSPDGQRVVYALAETAMQKSFAVVQAHVYVANADGTAAKALTKGNVLANGPQWSADGQWIAWMNNGNLYRVQSDGNNGEFITQGSKFAITSFKWSPDGSAIAFTEHQSFNPTPSAGLVVGAEVRNDRLCVVATTKNADGKYEVRKLTGSDYHVYTARDPMGGYDWSPDSKTIAFARVKSSRIDDWPMSDLWLCEVATGAMRPLAATEAAEANPLFSPDGKWVACTVSDVPVTWSRKHRVQLIPLQGGAPKLLAPTFDDAPFLVGWSEDGGKLYYTENHRTTMQLFALPLEEAPVAVSKVDGVLSDVHFNTTRTAIGFSVQGVQAPQEGFVSKIDNFAPVQVTKVNELLRKRPIAKTEVIHWKGPDALEIEGLLTYPLDYAPGKRYPLLLVIHGGPAGVFPQTFIANPSTYPVATFAEQGYAVLRCNPRGSTGYGAKFRQANHKDWGGKDFQDLMLGVDHVIGMGVADEKKMGVMGWSYGGYMTAWTITQTQRFKAASVGAAVTNLVSFTGTTDVPSFLPSYFGGEFWDNPGVYEKHSPMFHVKKVKTPALIQHGDSDARVPISQGYELYNALKRQGCVAQMVVYPGQPHGLASHPMLDAMERNLAWMEKYVK